MAVAVTAERLAWNVLAAPGSDRLAECAALTPVVADELIAILGEASRFAEEHLVPLRTASDRIGCRLENGRVATAPGHRQAWDVFVSNGFPLLDLPVAAGGLALPRGAALAMQELLDRSCPAFGMLALPTRSAARLIDSHGDAATRAEWLPELASGRWGATICISESSAGSDVARVRTIARRSGERWSISGEKSWISFGDHDLTDRIGHCVLARTEEGHGLSLFLVPDSHDDGSRNTVAVQRLEEKLGLHGSPTCVMLFDDADAVLLGAVDRGVAQMFTMITNMRLTVGAMGLGIAQSALDVAVGYAGERRQGGSPKTAPVLIGEHADVQRMLLDMAAQITLLRGLCQATAVQADLGDHHPDPVIRAASAAASAWLLPIVKTFGGETAISCADTAIQVLGGAGYTREWPVEQALRDARVLTIFEGTTTIQALDLLRRRATPDNGSPMEAFVALAGTELAGDPRTAALNLPRLLRDRAHELRNASPVAGDGGATAYLHLAIVVACAWIAVRASTGPTGDRAVADHWLDALGCRLSSLVAAAAPDPTLNSRYQEMIA